MPFCRPFTEFPARIEASRRDQNSSVENRSLSRVSGRTADKGRIQRALRAWQTSEGGAAWTAAKNFQNESHDIYEKTGT